MVQGKIRLLDKIFPFVCHYLPIFRWSPSSENPIPIASAAPALASASSSTSSSASKPMSGATPAANYRLDRIANSANPSSDSMSNSNNTSNGSDSSGTLTNGSDNPYSEPTTGPLYWERRRAEWLRQNSNQSSDPSNQSSAEPEKASDAKARLEALLAAPGAEEDDLVWNDTILAIWKGLVRGDRLKKNLPLPIIIRILRGGWLRDGTWPHGQPPPEDSF